MEQLDKLQAKVTPFYLDNLMRSESRNMQNENLQQIIKTRDALERISSYADNIGGILEMIDGHIESRKQRGTIRQAIATSDELHREMKIICSDYLKKYLTLAEAEQADIEEEDKEYAISAKWYKESLLYLLKIMQTGSESEKKGIKRSISLKYNFDEKYTEALEFAEQFGTTTPTLASPILTSNNSHSLFYPDNKNTKTAEFEGIRIRGNVANFSAFHFSGIDRALVL